MNKKSSREKINFAAIKNRFWEGPNSIKEELRLRKLNRKKVNDLDKLETEIKEMGESKIEIIEDKRSKLLGDLNMEEGFEIEGMKNIETKIPKQ